MTAPASVWPNHCDASCPCRLEESRCVIRCACQMCEIGQCGYCDVAVGKTTRGPKEFMGSKEADDARMDAARERGRAESSAQVDAARDAFLSQPLSKPKRGKQAGKTFSTKGGAAKRKAAYAKHNAELDNLLPEWMRVEVEK